MPQRIHSAAGKPTILSKDIRSSERTILVTKGALLVVKGALTIGDQMNTIGDLRSTFGDQRDVLSQFLFLIMGGGRGRCLKVVLYKKF